MADLLAMSTFRGYKRGDKIEGVVSSIAGREVLIDIGGKMEGIVGEKEWDVEARANEYSYTTGDACDTRS